MSDAPLIGIPSIVKRLPAAEYHAHPAMSAGDAITLLQTCEAVYRHRKTHPVESTPALDFGNAAHCWVLENGTFEARYHVLPEGFNAGQTKKQAEAIAERDAAVAAGKMLVKADDLETIKAMAESVRRHPLARHAFVAGEPEVSLFWHDEEIGIDCRARLDWLPHNPSAGIFPDLKSTKDAKPDELMKDMWNHHYFLRAAWYEDGLRALGFDGARYLPIFVDKSPPHEVVPVWPSEAALSWGRILMKRARAVVAHCTRAGHWPGYTDDAITLGIPYWAEIQLQEKHERGDFETLELMAQMQAPLDQGEAA